MSGGDKQFAYERIAEAITAELTNSLWRVGDELPSELELAAHFDVARRTIRKALTIIEKSGLIAKGKGRRTRYRGRTIDWSHDMVTGLPAAARRAGLRVSTRVLRLAEVRSGLSDARALGRPLGSPVAELWRLRLLDGKPMVQQRSVLPSDILARIAPGDLTRHSLYDLLRGVGDVGALFVAEEHFSPAQASAEEAGFGIVEEGRPVLRVTRIVADAARPVEYSNSILLGPAFRF